MAVNRDDVSLFDSLTKKFGSGVSNIGGALAGFGQGVAEAMGSSVEPDPGNIAFNLKVLADTYEGESQRMIEEAGGYQSFVTGEDSLKAKWAKGNLRPIDVGRAVTDVAMQQLPQLMVGGMAARAGRTALSPLIASALPKLSKPAVNLLASQAGATGVIAAQETGSIYREQDEKDFLKALGFGTLAGSLEAAGLLYGGSKAGLGKYLAGELADTGVRTAKQIGKDILKTTATEAATEGAQTALEQVGAGKELDATEMLEAAIAGGVLGGGMTSVTAPVTNKLAKVREARKRGIQEAEDEAALRRQALADETEGKMQDEITPVSMLDDAPSLEERKVVLDAAEKADKIEQEKQTRIEAVDQATKDVEATVIPDAPAHVVEEEIAASSGEDIQTVRKEGSMLFEAAKNFGEWSANMIKRFGQIAKGALLRLWNYFKGIQPGLSVKQVDKDPIDIWSTGKTGFEGLSNFAAAPIAVQEVIEGRTVDLQFQTTEQHYQFKKAIINGDIDMARKIYSLKGDPVAVSRQAKALGKKVQIDDLEAWQEIEADVLEASMREGFNQNPEKLELLMATGSRPLTHIKDTGRWAQDFPAILDKIRSEYGMTEQEDVPMTPQEEMDAEYDARQDYNTQLADEMRDYAAEMPEIREVEYTTAEPEALMQRAQELYDEGDMEGMKAAQKMAKQAMLERIAKNEATLPDGRVISFNEQQVEGLQLLSDFVQGNLSGNTFMLQGYAGTGKTTLIKQVTDALGATSTPFIVTAPTHKAAQVIAMSTDMDTMTVHKALALKPVEDYKTGTQRFEQARDEDGDSKSFIPAGGFVIVDESSMINEELYGLLMDQANELDTKVIFMGDEAQIPPVGENQISITFRDADNKHQLTKVERTAGGNPLMPVFDAIRGDITSTKDLFEHKSSIIDKGGVKQGVGFTNSVPAFVAALKKAFGSQDWKDNHDFARLIAYRNDAVRDWNHFIRKIVFGDLAEQSQFVEGELLVGKDNVYRNKDLVLQNSSEYIFEKIIDTGVTPEGYQYSTIQVKDGGMPKTIDVIHEAESVLKHEKTLNAIKERAKKAQGRERGMLWRDWFRAQQTGPLIFGKSVYSHLDYGYALTAHKSQGSTYDTVFIDEDDIDRRVWFSKLKQSKAFIDRERNSLKYVAFSRASRMAFSLSEKTTLSYSDPAFKVQMIEAAEEKLPASEVKYAPVEEPSVEIQEAGIEDLTTEETKVLATQGLAAPQRAEETETPVDPAQPIPQSIQAAVTADMEENGNPQWKHKEVPKTRLANKFIGQGSSGSWTEKYRAMYVKHKAANNPTYTADDIIMLAANGNRQGGFVPVDKDGNLQGMYRLIDRAITAGATFVADTHTHLKNTFKYNTGEIALSRYLLAHGYERVQTEQNVSIWKPAKPIPIKKDYPGDKIVVIRQNKQGQMDLFPDMEETTKAELIDIWKMHEKMHPEITDSQRQAIFDSRFEEQVREDQDPEEVPFEMPEPEPLLYEFIDDDIPRAKPSLSPMQSDKGRTLAPWELAERRHLRGEFSHIQSLNSFLSDLAWEKTEKGVFKGKRSILRPEEIDARVAEFKAKNAKTLGKILKQVYESDALTDLDHEVSNIKGHVGSEVSVADLMEEDLRRLATIYNLADIHAHVLRTEGVKSFAALETYPKSLLDFIDYAIAEETYGTQNDDIVSEWDTKTFLGEDVLAGEDIADVKHMTRKARQKVMDSMTKDLKVKPYRREPYKMKKIESLQDTDAATAMNQIWPQFLIAVDEFAQDVGSPVDGETREQMQDRMATREPDMAAILEIMKKDWRGAQAFRQLPESFTKLGEKKQLETISMMFNEATIEVQFEATQVNRDAIESGLWPGVAENIDARTHTKSGVPSGAMHMVDPFVIDSSVDRYTERAAIKLNSDGTLSRKGWATTHKEMLATMEKLGLTTQVAKILGIKIEDVTTELVNDINTANSPGYQVRILFDKSVKGKGSEMLWATSRKPRGYVWRTYSDAFEAASKQVGQNILDFEIVVADPRDKPTQDWNASKRVERRMALIRGLILENQRSQALPLSDKEIKDIKDSYRHLKLSTERIQEKFIRSGFNRLQLHNALKLENQFVVESKIFNLSQGMHARGAVSFDEVTTGMTAEEKANFKRYLQGLRPKTKKGKASFTKDEETHFAALKKKLQNKSQDAMWRAEKMVTAGFTDEEVKMYRNFKAGIVSGLPYAQKKYFDALRHFEFQIMEETTRNYQGHQSLAAIKSEHGFNPNLEDFFTPKKNLTDFEMDLHKRGVRVGELSSRLSQRFYQLVAKLFGADLVVVTGDYRSRYMPTALDGRPKVIVNVDGDASFHRIFAHEIFHHIVNRSAPGAYREFKRSIIEIIGQNRFDEMATNVILREHPELQSKILGLNEKVERIYYRQKDGRSFEEIYAEERNKLISRSIQIGEKAKSLAEEEVLAEAYAEVMSDRNFYLRMAKTLEGKVLGRRIITRLLEGVADLADVMTGPVGRPFDYEQKIFVNSDQMSKVRDLVIDIMTDGRSASGKLQHGEWRYHTPVGDITETEATNLQKAKNYGGGVWKALFPNGLKSYKDIMTAVERILAKIRDTIVKLKPTGIFADLLVDPEQAALVYKMAHGAELHVSNAYHQVVKKYESLFKKYSKKELEELHDTIVRGGLDVSNMADYESVAKKYGKDVADCFREYKRVSDEIYAKLKEIYPELPEVNTHYGQSIKWRRKNGLVMDDEFDWVVTPEKSRLEGTKHFTKDMNMKDTTPEIAAKYDLEYQTIDPHQLFLTYVRDANRLILVREFLEKASTQKDKQGRPFAKMFDPETEQYQAATQGYYPVEDNGLKLFKRINMPNRFVIRTYRFNDAGVREELKKQYFATKEEADIAFADLNDSPFAGEYDFELKEEVKAQERVISHYVVKGERIESAVPTKIKSQYDTNKFQTKKAAEQHAAELNMKYPSFRYSAEPVYKTPEVVNAGQLFFRKDTARMLNVLLASDPLRNGSFFGISGRQVMGVKNMQTSAEFALSLFHFMTISQETAASYASWAQTMKRAGKVPGFNMRRAHKEGNELIMLMEALQADKELAKHPAIQKEAERLLGIKDVDLMDMIAKFYESGGLMHQDVDLRSAVHKWGTMKYTKGQDFLEIVEGQVVYHHSKFSPTAIKDSFKDVWDDTIRNEGSIVKAAFKTGMFASLESTSAWLMEYMIPRTKAAMWMREYTMKIERNARKIEAGTISKEEIARQTTKFIEDRFGEVNWINMWMRPSYKTALQFMFRSFTWVAGSWIALSKSGLDLAQMGWYRIKGEKRELTERGKWGYNAFAAHVMTVGLITAVYQAVVLGDREVPDDEDTPWLTKFLFPRIDRLDPQARLTVPSYITELYKILRHFGIIGNHAEYSKLITGRVNSLTSNMVEVIQGEDWRGVSISNPNDSFLKRQFDNIKHILFVAPISLSTMYSNWERKGFTAWKPMLLATLGFTDAPAAAKRSDAANKAFEIRRREYKGRDIDIETMENKLEIQRAMYAYAYGDREPLQRLRRDGEISPRQYQNALARLPLIDGKPNPLYKDPLSSAMKGLTIKGALEVWEYMSENERKKHKFEIIKKYNNMMVRKDHPMKYKQEVREEMKPVFEFK